VHPNVGVVRRLYQAFISRDPATLVTLVGSDLTLHVPGRSAFAGTHRGPEQILSVFYRSGTLAAHSFRLELHDVVGGPDHVVGIHHITGSRDGRVLDQKSYLVCHVRDGVIVEVWVAVADVRQWDAFWS